MKTFQPLSHASLRSKLAVLLGSALVCSSLAALAADSPNERPESEARVSRTMRDLERNTIRDAKGNRIQLSSIQPDAEPLIWAHKDLDDDKVPGTSTEKAYKTLTLKAPKKPIIVAVLDSGVDIHHPDLAGLIWTNPKEAAGKPGVDDDGDGYVDDVNGWNFIGNKNGTNLGSSTLEVTREVKRMRDLAKTRSLTKTEQAYLADVEKTYAAKQTDTAQTLDYIKQTEAQYLAALDVLKAAGLTAETQEAVDALTVTTDDQKAAKAFLSAQLARGRDSKFWANVKVEYQNQIDYYYNLDFDPSQVIGDNPKNPTEKYYGNSDVRALGADHGTHCSGIIGALRNNGIGMDGQSNFLRIMPVRAVPDGDERDKDIANGIRFAVDHGARIISMSFGKPYSPGKKLVDAAVAYARKKGVLLIHAAGNDSLNTDVAKNFPTPRLLDGDVADNWIEVGASSRFANEDLPATFSNYGKKSVDLFAPGVDIYSTTPDGTYSTFSGTSMATPEVAGIAALILSQKPSLTPQQLKKILTSTVTTFEGLSVKQPLDGEGDAKLVPFSTLSKTGGVVNALRALRTL